MMTKADLLKKTSNVEDEFNPDAHSCRAEADAYGHCTWCGATVFGSIAYYDETGSDPPETVRYPY